MKSERESTINTDSFGGSSIVKSAFTPQLTPIKYFYPAFTLSLIEDESGQERRRMKSIYRLFT